VDYTRSPGATNASQVGPAIDTNVFDLTETESWYWTGTTHVGADATFAAYVCIGRAWGYVEMPPGSGNTNYVDVHGAGAQRSDPKSGDPNDPQWSGGHGPQGDEVRISNYVRCVRSGNVTAPAGDTDGDGLSDWYEYDYTTNLTAMAADGDNDGDGASNRSENGAGTSPLDAGSFLGITDVTAGSGGIVVTWSSVYGKRYVLARSSNLVTDAYSTEVAGGIDGGLTVNVFTDTTVSAESAAGYRVGVE
jgi:hypothetical protein